MKHNESTMKIIYMQCPKRPDENNDCLSVSVVDGITQEVWQIFLFTISR